MASLRKKYQPVESSHRDDDAPVAASPRPTAAAPPPAVEEHPEPPKLEERPPEEIAARAAIQSRLAEMQEAREPVEQPHAAEPLPRQQTPEEFIDHLDVPETTKKWLKKHPEVITDSALGQEVRALHNTARRRAGGEEFSENYFRAMDNLLGFESAENARHLPPSEPVRPPYNGAPPRAQPPRQPSPGPRVSTQPPAAPPTREAFSMSTGRAMSHSPPLTEAERIIAQQSFQTKDGISPDDQYRATRDRLKRDGIIGGTGYGR